MERFRTLVNGVGEAGMSRKTLSFLVGLIAVIGTITACSESPVSPIATTAGVESSSPLKYGGGYGYEEGYFCDFQDYYVNNTYQGTDMFCVPDGISNPILPVLDGSGETCFGVCIAGTNEGGSYYGSPAPPSPNAEPPTAAEIAACVSSPEECGVVWAARQQAGQWVQMNAPPGSGYNDVWDARRHALWSGLMAMNMQLGASSAEYWGDLHEQKDGNPAGEKCMDLHNNSIGRQLGTAVYNNSSIAPGNRTSTLIQEIMSSNSLQTSPGC